jgi:hypothetical protein
MISSVVMLLSWILEKNTNSHIISQEYDTPTQPLDMDV